MKQRRDKISTIPSVSNKDENGVAGWEKSVVDVNNIDESFSNARDLGYTRLNYARVTAIAELGKYNERDIYKIQVQSNGKMSISLRSSDTTDEKVLDLSEYEEYLDNLKQQLDPEGYAAEKAEKEEAVQDEGAANMLAAGYSNIASLTSDSSSSSAASKLFSTILSGSQSS